MTSIKDPDPNCPLCHGSGKVFTSKDNKEFPACGCIIKKLSSFGQQEVQCAWCPTIVNIHTTKFRVIIGALPIFFCSEKCARRYFKEDV